MERAILVIHGRVQRVFFRHLARLEAKRLNLLGQAKNETDGTLTIIAEGDPAKLNNFVTWCRKGPPLARVDSIEVRWERTAGEFEKFEIL